MDTVRGVDEEDRPSLPAETYVNLLRTMSEVTTVQAQHVVLAEAFALLNFDWDGSVLPYICDTLFKWYNHGSNDIKNIILRIFINATLSNRKTQLYEICHDFITYNLKIADSPDLVEHLLWILVNLCDIPDTTIRLTQHNECIFGLTRMLATRWQASDRVLSTITALLFNISAVQPMRPEFVDVCLWLRCRIEFISKNSELNQALLMFRRCMSCLPEHALGIIFDPEFIEMMINWSVQSEFNVIVELEIFDNLISMPNEALGTKYANMLADKKLFLALQGVFARNRDKVDVHEAAVWLIGNMCEDPENVRKMLQTDLIHKIFDVVRNPATSNAAKSTSVLCLCDAIKVSLPTRIKRVVDDGCIEVFAKYMNEHATTADVAVVVNILAATKLIIDAGPCLKVDYLEAMEFHGMKQAIETFAYHKNPKISTFCDALLSYSFDGKEMVDDVIDEPVDFFTSVSQ